MDFQKEFRKRNSVLVNEKLSNAVVGIAGCGGLGSNIATMLTRAGINKLIIVDFDTIIESNLNRQNFFYDDVGFPKVEALERNLKKINPDIHIEKHKIKVVPENLQELFSEADVIVEAFDKVSEKTMILNSFIDIFSRTEKSLVSGSGMAGIASSNIIETKKLSNNVYICGDFTNEANVENGIMSPRVNIVAAHQANMVMRLLCGIDTI